MKKIFPIFIGAILAVVMGLAIGCSNSQSAVYYDIAFTEIDGVTYECEIKDGAEVLKGYTVRFSIDIDRNVAEGDPVVKVNGEEVKPDGEGVYSFVMSGDTVISVDGLINIERYAVTFDEGTTRTKFESDMGDTTDGLLVAAGEEVSFKVKKSSYFTGKMTVLANTAVLTPDADGVYKVAVTENINISVLGLVQEDPFYLRENTGDGTAAHPYLLSRPIDLFTLSSLVSEGFYTEVPTAYYRLAQDIDMEGEQLYVIGDASNETSFFAGHFDGAGHKISNYFIDDVIIEQETFTEIFLPYLGMFGYVSASVDGPAEISNLTLENFTISVDSSVMASGNSLVGGLVGYGVGVSITGCSVSGKIEVKSGTKEDTLSYAGGVAAIIESATLPSGAMVAGAVRSCSSAVEIEVKSGNAYAAGGIVGFLRADENKTPAYVVNCYSTQSVVGAMNCGGIVGITSANSAVSNCYSSALTVTAVTNIRGSENLVLNHSFAGGIVGYLVGGSVITDSFSVVGRVAATASSGQDYIHYGDIYGFADNEKANNIEDAAAYAYNSYTIRDGIVFNRTFYRETLGWNESDWNFSGTYPTINHEESHFSYTVTVRQVTRTVSGTQTEFSAKRFLAPIQVTDAYYPLAFWYYLDNAAEEYFFDGSRGTYGYYFDKEMTLPVPISFVPTKDVTFFVEFVDYGKVAGSYYISDDICLELKGDGTLVYNNGARHYPSYYVYDGSRVIMYDTLLSKLLYGELVVTEFEAVWVEEDNCLYWYDIFSYYAGTRYKANKILPKFEYGEYRNEDAQGNTQSFTFYRHGFGVYESGDEKIEFSFTVSGNDVNIEFDSEDYTTATATLENGIITAVAFEGNASATVKKVDIFAGVWEREVGRAEKYAFDGLGGFIFYNGETHDGSYNLDGEKLELTFAGGETVNGIFDGSFITVGEDKFYRENSFVGTWVYGTAVPVEIELDGIAADGIGNATVSYGTADTYAVRYAAFEGEDGKITVELYYYDSVLGVIGYTSDGTLLGQIYIPSQLGGSIDENARFCAYDSFRGTWVSGNDDFYVLNFNGFGKYDLAGSGNALATRGSVSVTVRNEQGIETTSSVAYTSEDADHGEFTFGGKTYTVTLSGNTVTVEGNGESVTLVPRDGFFGFELIDTEGSVYAFDGRGGLDEGGEVTVTAGDGTKTTFGYTLSGENITIAGYPLVNDGESYGWNGVTLYVNNGISGEWIVGGTVDGSLTVGKIGADLSPEVSFMDEEVSDVTYDTATGALTFVWQKSVITVEALYSYDTDENGNLVGKAVELNLNYDGTDYTCVKSDTLDNVRGKYEAEDGSFVYLDGLTASIYGNGGVAMIIDGATQSVYNYMIDDYGHILFTESGETYRLFVVAEKGKYQNGDYGYDLVKPDYLYGREVYRQNPDGSAGSYVYLFDGIDTVYNSAGRKLYTYVMHEQTEQDKLELILRLTFTDESGTLYEVEIDYGSTELSLRMTEMVE